METTYSLVFSGGILSGFEPDAVKREFAAAFGMPAADVDRVFCGSRAVLKRLLEGELAQRHCDRLRNMGMDVGLEPTVGAMAPAAVPPPVAPIPAAAEPLPASPAPVPEAAIAPAAEPSTVRPPAARAGAVDTTTKERFEFSGQAGEYFRIWIVNLVLSILTLGIYSAWAKVRTMRYFYGNTRLAGSSFEYLADPLRILKGRMIAIVFVVVYTVAGQLAPLFAAVLGLVLFFATPWIIVQSMRFRTHYSRWRGVHFGFDGTTREAVKVFVGWSLLGLVTLGLLMPYAVYRQRKFVLDNVRYGSTHLQFTAGKWGFYKIALVIVGLFFVGGVMSAISAMVAPVLTPIGFVGMYLVVFVVAMVMFANLTFNHLLLGEHRFGASYGYRSYGVLAIVNMLAIMVTLGLAYPWARIRSARYAAEHLLLNVHGTLDDFAQSERVKVDALGGELSDVLDIDLGF